MATLLLSDLHLPPSASTLRETFLRFLSGPARQAKRVYILGDLFEVWIGDDIGLRYYQPEVEALRALVRYGVPVYFQHGNRDFLVGQRFSAATGVQLLPDPARIDLEGKMAVVSHGDRFCTDDRDYQRWRRFSRNRVAQWLFLHLPESRRRRIAGDIRGRSEQNREEKAADIMDVNGHAIESTLRSYAVSRLIHGHTHRPADHALRVDGKPCTRTVLADWRPERMEYLRVDGSGMKRIAL